MNFFAPERLLLLWGIFPLAYLLYLGNRNRIRRIRAFAGEHAESLLSHPLKKNRSLVKALLFTGAAVSIVVALSRPRWGYEWRNLPQGGTDIMVVLDLSRSMLATDIKPSRLERAKREIVDLVEMLQGDRLGIIPFA